ncbi:MAG: hypothetical protein GY793_06440 [Proteobacteria bacterium]|nr:hypothetical protein [Pseudomonadota bacterium]
MTVKNVLKTLNNHAISGFLEQSVLKGLAESIVENARKAKAEHKEDFICDFCNDVFKVDGSSVQLCSGCQSENNI